MKFGASTFIWVSPFSNDTLDLVDKVAALGFDLIEVCVEDPATIDTTAIRRRIEAAGIGATVCGAFGPDRDMSADDPAIRRNAIDYVERCAEIASELGADIVVGPMYSAVGRTRMAEPDERRAQRTLAADSIRKAADHAAARGVRLGIEPLNRFETDLVNTVEQGVGLVEEIGRDNVGLLLDTFHMNIEEKDLPAALRRAGRHIFEFHACSSDRGTPGEDHLDWTGIAAALADAGYDGAVVIEAFTPKIKEIARAVSIWRPLAESEDALAANGLAHLKRVFA
ncbi:sugar phosphate isomerase/epimerase family protein [Prosthecomicrobium pneumaticum]|uniref:D-psicose/D-tagatose/L-ribulose 3-epimerase n=1 Tax=Prosthecomicrobium pneumaticum TaxID=81895 RepID=A0A7W9FQU1_9HYPH|nr:sugar phosphate isomerase/epimerase family protein [Prosthecomicrobium pneumaticum]MBB5755170.1 D-psicose/D-tagatose/L-ribulose 3-epimerase [Prosthecomicrobium pneumaticum]